MSNLPDEPLSSRLDALQTRALVAGLAATALVVVAGLIWPQTAWPAYLVGFLYWVGLSVGCLSLTMLHHLTGGNWGLPIRRPMEAGARTIVLMAVLFVPLWFFRAAVYPWVNPTSEMAEIVRPKAAYLNTPFWTIRAIVYFAIWAGLAYLLTGWSRQQDHTEDTTPSWWSRNVSGPGLAVIFLTGTFAAIDWIMSLEPAWYSTIYSAMVIVGWGLATFAAMVLAAGFLSRYEPMAHLVTPGRLNDLGNLMLAFVMLWAYMSFSQYLIIWSGNLTEEIPWYLKRTHGGWGAVALSLIVLHFFVPFFILLSRDVKRRVESLRVVAAIVLVMRLVDLTWLVAPAPYDPVHPGIPWMTLLLVPIAAAGMGGLWLGGLIWNLKGAPLVPEHDPHIVEALEHAAEH
jgi:hypothetical protein